MPRPRRKRKISSPPKMQAYKPIGLRNSVSKTISLLFEEYEALKLADYKILTHEEAAKLMNISRPTFTRIYESARRKIAQAFVEGKIIQIKGGDVNFDNTWYKCNECFEVYKSENDSTIKFCKNCESENIVNLNENVNIKDIKPEKEVLNIKKENKEFCKCIICDYKEEKKQDTDCSSVKCPKCNIPLVNENILNRKF